MPSSSTAKWVFITILCIFFTRPPSCHCPATCHDPSTPNLLLVTKTPHPPVPVYSPPSTLPPFRRLPVPNFTKPLKTRRSTIHPLAPVSLARCQIFYMQTYGMTLSRAVTQCSMHRDRAVAGGRIVGSHIILPPPSTPTVPTRISATRTTPSAPRPYTCREGVSLIDRPRHGAGVVLRDDVIRAVRDSRIVELVNGLRKSAKPRWRKLVRSACVWYARLKWFVRISIEEEDLRNGNLLGLLWFGSWLVADQHDEELESDTENMVTPEIPPPTRPLIKWYPVGERDVNLCVGLHSAPRPSVQEDVLASVTLSTLPPRADLVPPPTRLIEWRPATQIDQSQPSPATVSRQPRRVRPGHWVYQPPAMQTGLTQEHRVARSAAQRQMLEQVEREAQELVPVPEVAVEAHTNKESRRRGKRGGTKVRVRREEREERLARAAAGGE